MNRLAVIVLILVGCGTTPVPRNNVSGTVSLSDRPFEPGIVTLHGPDGQESTGAILPGGKYSIDDPPLGKCHVTVKPPPGFDSPVAANAADPHSPPPEAKKTRIPSRYSAVGNGLTVDVRPGQMLFDIVMVP